MIDIKLSIFFTVWLGVGFGLPVAMIVLHLFRKKVTKNKYITLRKCDCFDCEYNHAEVCFLREDIYSDINERGLYCQKDMLAKAFYSLAEELE